MVIGGKLDPREEDFELAVARALRQMNAADSERALWMLIASDWTGPPGVTSCSAGKSALKEKGMPSAEKFYPLSKLPFVLECWFLCI